jgi:competence protein ComEC
VAVSVIVGLLGLARTCAALPPDTPPPGSLRSYNVPAAATDAAPVTVRGIVRVEPYLNNTHRYLLIAVDSQDLWRDGAWQPAPGGLLVLGGRFNPAHRGDRVSVTGVLQEAPSFPGFDYRAYLLRQDLGSYMRVASIRVLESEADRGFGTVFEQARRHAGEQIARLLPEPQAGLLRGIMLGENHRLGPDLRDAFSLTGTAHIVALSGTNITIAIIFLFFLTRPWLPHRPAVALAIVVVVAYTLFVGAEPPVVRAAIMGSCYLIAQALGRPTHGLTLLGAAALLMTLYQPLMVLEVSFQLSFMAMVGLIVLAPRLLVRFKRLPPGVRELLAATIAAQVFTDPLIAFHFGAIPLIGPLANLLAEPALPVIMALGAPVIVLGAIWEPLGQVAAWLCWVPLTWLVEVVQGMARVPGASLPLPDFGIAALLAWYGMLVVLLAALSAPGRAGRVRIVRQWYHLRVRVGRRSRRHKEAELGGEDLI